MLALTYLHPEIEYSLTDISRLTGASVKAVHQEVSRLVEAELLTDRRVGNVRLVRVGVETPLTRPLTDLLAVTFGPLSVVPDSLRGVPDVDRAFIYGSWAARYSGEVGPPPVDVDVLVVGSADLDDLDAAGRRAESRLGRPVSIRKLSRSAWAQKPGSAFLETIRSRPLVEVDLPV